MYPQSTGFGIKSCNSKFCLEILEWNCFELNVLREKYVQNQQNQIKKAKTKPVKPKLLKTLNMTVFWFRFQTFITRK